MQTIQYRKSRISEMKEDEYTKSLARIIGLCNISYARYSEILPKFLKLCMVAVKQQKHLFLSFLMLEFFA